MNKDKYFAERLLACPFCNKEMIEVIIRPPYIDIKNMLCRKAYL